MHFNYSMAAIISVLVFIIAFAFSAGPVVWVLCSEIQPLKGRDFGITCSTGANWLSNMAIAATFLPLLSLLGADITMLYHEAVEDAPHAVTAAVRRTAIPNAASLFFLMMSSQMSFFVNSERTAVFSLSSVEHLYQR